MTLLIPHFSVSEWRTVPVYEHLMVAADHGFHVIQFHTVLPHKTIYHKAATQANNIYG